MIVEGLTKTRSLEECSRINSIKKIIDKKYISKFTHRKDNSKWSELNKKRVDRFFNNNKITEIELN